MLILSHFNWVALDPNGAFKTKSNTVILRLTGTRAGQINEGGSNNPLCVGLTAYFVCLVSGQVIAGMALSHFGFLSPQPLPVTPNKFIGAAAVIIGVLLIRYAEGQQLQAGEARSKNATLAADRDRPSGGGSLAGSDRDTLSG